LNGREEQNIRDVWAALLFALRELTHAALVNLRKGIFGMAAGRERNSFCF
jgi:hypothetical protein